MRKGLDTERGNFDGLQNFCCNYSGGSGQYGTQFCYYDLYFSKKDLKVWRKTINGLIIKFLNCQEVFTNVSQNVNICEMQYVIRIIWLKMTKTELPTQTLLTILYTLVDEWKYPSIKYSICQKNSTDILLNITQVILFVITFQC